MFSKSITMFDQEIQRLQEKREAIESISEVASNAIDGINKTLEVLENYPEEKQQFIDTIASLIGSSPISTETPIEHPKDMGNTKKTSKKAVHIIDFSDYNKLAVNDLMASTTTAMGDFNLIIPFDNKRSRKGVTSNSAIAWGKEITKDFPRISYEVVDNNESSPFDSKYLLKLWNIPELAISQLTRYNFRLDPEAAKAELEVIDNPGVGTEEKSTPTEQLDADKPDEMIVNDDSSVVSQEQEQPESSKENIAIVPEIQESHIPTIPQTVENVTVDEAEEEFSVF